MFNRVVFEIDQFAAVVQAINMKDAPGWVEPQWLNPRKGFHITIISPKGCTAFPEGI